MAKSQVSAASFLKNIEKLTGSEGSATPPTLISETAPPPEEAAKPTPATKSSKGRAGLKHIGGYLDRETVELIAILRARLRLDNSQLIKRAIEEMYSRETAARKFGDR